MDPKSGKPMRIFNPLTIWTDIALKSGAAMLDARKRGYAAESDEGGRPSRGRRAAAQVGAHQAVQIGQESAKKRVVSACASGR
jgi:hypothetical protein